MVRGMRRHGFMKAAKQKRMHRWLTAKADSGLTCVYCMYTQHDNNKSTYDANQIRTEWV